MARAARALPNVVVSEPVPVVWSQWTFLSGAWRRFVARKLVLVGVVLVAILLMIGALGRVIAPYRPTAQDLQSVLSAPTASHWLGTDELGRDVLSRLLWGATISLQVGISAVLLASVPGVIVGTYVGYRRGYVDHVVMRVLDGLMAFPALILALTIVAVLGSNIFNVILAIAVTTFPHYARLVRGQVLFGARVRLCPGGEVRRRS